MLRCNCPSRHPGLDPGSMRQRTAVNGIAWIAPPRGPRIARLRRLSGVTGGGCLSVLGSGAPRRVGSNDRCFRTSAGNFSRFFCARFATISFQVMFQICKRYKIPIFDLTAAGLHRAGFLRRCFLGRCVLKEQMMAQNLANVFRAGIVARLAGTVDFAKHRTRESDGDGAGPSTIGGCHNRCVSPMINRRISYYII